MWVEFYLDGPRMAPYVVVQDRGAPLSGGNTCTRLLLRELAKLSLNRKAFWFTANTEIVGSK